MTVPPPPDALTAPWWEATRERRLLLQRCTRCAAFQHHPRAVCAACGAYRAHTWVEACGRAAVDCFTVVHRAPDPDTPVPYTVARVRLAEGPVMLTRLLGGPRDETLFDAELALDWLPLPDGRALPVFTVIRTPAQGT